MDTMALLLGAQLVTLLSPVPWSSTFSFLQIGTSQWKDNVDQGGGTGCGTGDGDKHGLNVYIY